MPVKPKPKHRAAKAPPKRYTSAEQAEALAVWLREHDEHGIHGSAIIAGIPQTTMRALVETTRGLGDPAVQAHYAAILAEAMELCVRRAVEMIPHMPATPEGLLAVGNVMRMASRAALEWRFGEGHWGKVAGERTETNNTLIVQYRDDWRPPQVDVYTSTHVSEEE